MCSRVEAEDVTTDFGGHASSLVSHQDQAGGDDGLLGPEQAYRLFDEQARAIVGMSGEELARWWDAGEYKDIDETPLHGEVIGLMMLRPRLRQGAA